MASSPGETRGQARPKAFARAAAWTTFAVVTLAFSAAGARLGCDASSRADEVSLARLEGSLTLVTLGSAVARVYASDRRVCPSASQRVPRLIPEARPLRASRAVSVDSSEWRVDDAGGALDGGFACMAFSMEEQPQRNQYEYIATDHDFVVRARSWVPGLEDTMLEVRGEIRGSGMVVGEVMEVARQ